MQSYLSLLTRRAIFAECKTFFMRVLRGGLGGFFILFVTLSLVACNKNLLNEARELHGEGDIAALEEALKKYDEVLYQALNAVEGQYDVQILMAIKFAEAGNYNACIERLQAAYDIKATDGVLYYYLGLCYTNLARATRDEAVLKTLVSEAEEAFDQGLEYDKNNALLYYGQGILLGFVQDRAEEAISWLEQSYALEPYDLNVLFALGNLYYRVNKLERSKHFYREVLDKTPKDSPKWKRAQENLAKIKKES